MMRGKKKKKSLEHIATALVPPAAFTAVPSTPPPTPPPTQKSKRLFGRKKTPSPSPILPTLLGVNLTTRAVGLNMGDSSISSARTSPDRSINYHDMSQASMVEEAGYASIPLRGRSRRRDTGEHSRDMIVEAEINETQGKSNMEGRHHDPYAQVQKGEKMKKNQKEKGIGKQPSLEHSLDPSDVQDLHDSLQQRQQQLEERIQMQNDETKEMFREVISRQHQSSIRADRRNSDEVSFDNDDFSNEALMEENSRLIRNNLSLVEQNKSLQSVNQILSSNGKKGSPRTQIEAILEENDTLRMTVDRLNTELDRFQQKYGVLPDSPHKKHYENQKEPKPKWLTNAEYLSPLFISYDAQLKEKDETIKALESNQEGDAAKDKWENMKQQNSLMAEEVQILMQQMEMAKQKAAEEGKKYRKEVADLTKSLALAEAEAETSGDLVKKLHQELSQLKKAHDKLVIESADKIPAREHIVAVNDLKNEIQDIKELNRKELGDLMRKIKNIEEQKNTLTLNVTDMKGKNKQLQGQIEALTQSYDKQMDKGDMLEKELEDADKRNTECESHLAEVLRLADKTAAERDALAALVEKEQRVTQEALRKSMLGKWEMGKMEQTVKQYKMKAANQMNDVADKIRGLEETHQSRLDEYHREMAHLRRLLQEKQTLLNDATHEKRLVENELENVWQATTSENRRIMDALYRSKVLD